MKCGGYVKGKCKTSQHVPVRLLEEAILAQLRRDAFCATTFVIQVIPSKEIDSLTQELAAVERKLLRLREAFLCGAETPEEYKVHKDTLSSRADLLRRKIEQQGDSQPLTETQLRQSLATLEDPDAPLEARHRAAAAILADCTWDKEKRLLTLIYHSP
jgi:hypothetical protein